MTTSDFTSAERAAWWVVQAGTTASKCMARGPAVLVSLQTVLRNGLRGGWRSFDGAHATRPTVDGNMGPQTLAALWSYVASYAPTAVSLAYKSKIEADAKAKRISAATTEAALLVTYYLPRKVDLDIAGSRTQRTDPPVLGILPPNSAVKVPENAVLWKYLERPAQSVDLGFVSLEVPDCQGIGAEWLLGEQPRVDLPESSARQPREKGGDGLFWALVLGGLYLATK